MATKVTTTTICDRKHRAEKEAIATVRFTTWDGKDLEADLCRGCAGEYADAVEPFADCARPAKAPAQAAQRKRKRSQASTALTEALELRAWARGHGWPGLGSQGRVPRAAREAYAARNGRTA